MSDRGVSDLWSSVNHIAIVVSDVGTSLSFYTDIIGMKQVFRPNFDRHGAWLTFGNVDLHLIKGRPAVHSDDDLIVSHIAITVSDMETMREKLKSLGCPYRTNISVPNPADTDTGKVEQAFVRDPDGYYIEFCNCEKLEKFLQDQMAQHEKKWDLSTTTSVMTLSPRMKRFADNAKKNLHPSHTEIKRSAYPDDLDELDMTGKPEIADPKILGNLLQRRQVYGDIMQNASKEELVLLLRFHNNNVPKVIAALESKIQQKGTRSYNPPAFYERDGVLFQPPTFEMKIEKEFE